MNNHYDHMNWVFDRVNLTDLEKLMYQLELTVRDIRCQSTDCSGLRLKTDHSYMTNDGYMTGSIVWFMNLVINDRRVYVFGNCPEVCVKNAITVFENYKALGDGFRKWLRDFESQQRGKADDYARYV